MQAETKTSVDQIAESFFLNQPTNGKNQGNFAGEIRELELFEIDSVVDAVNLRGVLRKFFLQLRHGEIAHCHDQSRSIENIR